MSYSDEYYCTNCNAILNDQPGFDPDKGTWVCTKCGHMMMADDVYRGDKYEGVAWFCDDCGALLNRQRGFTDSCGSWRCTACGHVNGTTEDDIGKFKCPNCRASLDIQNGFEDFLTFWTCTKCGANLQRDWSCNEFKPADDDTDEPKNDNDIEEQSSSYSDYSPSYSVSEAPESFRKHYRTRTTKSALEILEDIVDAIKGFFGLVFILLILAGFVFLGIGMYRFMDVPDNPADHPGEIRIEHSAFYYKWQNYYDTIIELRDKGFSDIQITPLNDLKFGIFPKSGKIKAIEVNGISDFYSDRLYSEQSVVSITYHSFAKKDKNGFSAEENSHLLIYGIDIQLPSYLIVDSISDTQARYHVKNDDETYFLFFNSDEQVLNEIEKFETYYITDSRETSSLDYVEKEIDILGKKNGKVYSVCISKFEVKSQTVYFLLVSPDNCKTDYSSDCRAILSGIYVPKDTEIQIDFNLKDYKGRNYEDVVAELKDKGFKNVRGDNLQDVVLGVVNKEGKIEKITINGSADYKAGDWIDEQAEIVITYHGKK